MTGLSYMTAAGQRPYAEKMRGANTRLFEFSGSELLLDSTVFRRFQPDGSFSLWIPASAGMTVGRQ